MKDILRTVIYVVVIVLAIYFAIWLISGNGIDIIKAKTNKAITGESFDKNGENVRSWLVRSEYDCKTECMWDTNQENPIYIYEELTQEEIEEYKSLSPLSSLNEKGHCYCKY